MDLMYTAEDQAFREQVRQWLSENLPKTKPETLEERRAWHRKLYEAGYLGMGWPKQYGGREARPMEQAIVGEELARVNAPPSLNGLGIGIVAPTLIHHGTEQQKRDHVRKHPHRRRTLVPVVFRAERRVRPRQLAVPGRCRGGRVHH